MNTRLRLASSSSSVVIGAFLSFLCGAPVTAQETEPSVSKVADVPWPVSVSPDGRLVTGFFTAGLAVRDLSTGETRNLSDKGFPGVFSPDGNQIAYTSWLGERDSVVLSLIRTDGSDQRLLFRDADMRSVAVKDWTEDGSRILVTIENSDSTAEVAYVPVDGGAPEVVVSLNPGEPFPQAMAVSPDGRFIAYDVRGTGPEGSAHDIYLMSGYGSAPKPIIQHPADDRLLDWSPDGKGILFASDRSGSVDIWLVPVADGVPGADVHPVKRDVGQFTPVGLARDGSYYFGVRRDDSHLYVADLVPETGRLDGQPRIVAPALYRSGVDWSPDGRYLAYAKPGGGVLEGSWVLVVRSLDTGAETEFKLEIDVLHRLRPSWSPDGQLLLLHGWGAYPTEGVYTVGVRTGEVMTLFTVEYPDRVIDWLGWSADGRAVFFTDGGRSRRDSTVGIVMRDLMSGRETDLYREIAPPYAGRLAPSPDGRLLAFCRWDENTDTDALNVMSLPEAEYQTVLQVSSPGFIWPPAWTPDSRHLVYQSQGHFWRISAAGGEPEDLGSLGRETYRRFLMSVHPNGHRIAFVGATESQWEVWKITGMLAAR